MQAKRAGKWGSCIATDTALSPPTALPLLARQGVSGGMAYVTAESTRGRRQPVLFGYSIGGILMIVLIVLVILILI